ncbi:MAG: UDP-N-acetylmuramoyl-L-alanine--D-glutamate ligase, partial [Thermaerobacterales bacterium]
MDFQGKRCAVVGLGRENTPLLPFLSSRGARVWAFDRQTADQMGDRLRQWAGLGLRWSLGPGYLEPLAVESFDYVFLTPGMVKDLPEIGAAADRGARVIGQVGLFLHLCPAPVIGITGSSGKSTTTSLIGHILESGGDRPVFVGGNIGRVLLEDLDRIPAESWVVLELSSFQLELSDRSPQIAVLLNIRPNHLDIHGTMAAYSAAKRRIYRFQTVDDLLVIPAEEAGPGGAAAAAAGRVVVCSIDSDAPAAPGAERPGDGVMRLAGKSIVWEQGGTHEHIMDAADVPLRGPHNVLNVLAAAAVTRSCGISAAAIAAAVRTFRPLEHRLEPVGEIAGVGYYNDSIATAPDRSIAALATFPENVVLIAGGYDKGVAFDDLAE